MELMEKYVIFFPFWSMNIWICVCPSWARQQILQLFGTFLGPWKVFPQKACSFSALLGDRQGWSWAAYTNLPPYTAVSSFLVGKLSKLMSITHLVKLRSLWNCCLQVAWLRRILWKSVPPLHSKAYFNSLANLLQFIYLFVYFAILHALS